MPFQSTNEYYILYSIQDEQVVRVERSCTNTNQSPSESVQEENFLFGK